MWRDQGRVFTGDGGGGGGGGGNDNGSSGSGNYDVTREELLLRLAARIKMLSNFKLVADVDRSLAAIQYSNHLRQS